MAILSGALVTKEGRIKRGQFQQVSTATDSRATTVRGRKRRPGRPGKGGTGVKHVTPGASGSRQARARRRAAARGKRRPGIGAVQQAAIPIIGAWDIEDVMASDFVPGDLGDVLWGAADEWDEWAEVEGCVAGRFGRFLRSVANVGKQIIKSPITKAVAGGVALAFPPVGVPASAALMAADRVVRATESAKPVVQEAARQLLVNTAQAARQGDQDAQRALEVTRVAKAVRKQRAAQITPGQRSAFLRLAVNARLRDREGDLKAAELDGISRGGKARPGRPSAGTRRRGKPRPGVPSGGGSRQARARRRRAQLAKGVRTAVAATKATAKAKSNAAAQTFRAYEAEEKAAKTGSRQAAMKARRERTKARKATRKAETVARVEQNVKEDLARDLGVVRGALVTAKGRIMRGRFHPVAT